MLKVSGRKEQLAPSYAETKQEVIRGLTEACA